ncbi:MAG: LysM peptidoglycan-binding domain-containing protein [Candidatus Syntrophosphaera sp.]|nr:LysM peptidoglycan-binding domain-containing protein [Candidatus Syntrophosphaera sp.]
MILAYDKTRDGVSIRPERRPGSPARAFALILLLALPLLLAAEFQTHTVKRGDNLYSIGRQYGVSVDQIKELNGLTSNDLRPNQVLKIKQIATPTTAPAQAGTEFQTHTVKRGDNLYSIGRQYGVSVERIKELNGLASNDIWPNQVLKIKPAQAPAPVSTTPSPATQAQSSAQSTTQRVQIPPTPPTTAARDTVASINFGRTQLPNDYYHVVAPKENLYRIAVNNGISLNDLLKWNGLADQNHVIRPGDKLIIADPTPFLAESDEYDETQTEDGQWTSSPEWPSITAAPDTVVVQQIYVVQKKDNLYRIALNHGMTVEELKRLNNLSSNTINVGQRLVVAGSPTQAGTSPRITQAELQTGDKLRTDLIMPTQGLVTSEYGLRNGRPHKGIDIAAKTGTPIYAVLDGVVVYSGIQGGYGNVVVLEHPDFVMTVYAHNEKNTVKVDDRVKQGDIIAYIGSTGQTTGSHLHFEYRLKGKALNPRKVLPLD